MKKLFCFLSVVSLALASCSSDDSSSSSYSDVLIKKIVETYSDGTSYTSNFSYSGNKLSTVTGSEGDVTKFYYTGDVITKIEYLEDGDVVQRDTFTYDANEHMTSHIMSDIDFDEGIKETYVQNGDGTVTLTQYNGDAASQTTLEGTGTITLVNGEVVSIVNDFSTDVTYTYDTHKNPAMNITGFDKMPYYGGEASGMVHHNILTEAWGSTTSTYSYIYNADDYPTSDVETDSGDATTTQYFYN